MRVRRMPVLGCGRRHRHTRLFDTCADHQFTRPFESLGTLELAADESWPWLQVYTGDGLPEGRRRRSLAVEPMTCPPNALADGADLVVLEPGEDWAGTWTLSWVAS